ncbi:hypothetical protein BDW59DRAFT_181521 [Aspergillus cavernicola]|uniref:Actin-like ATPase domain-containing protein n=1 Tax=Aspergillus cavernicola TaxID=176166 RepID=A0ABR4HYI8_9EURO
MPSQYAEGYMRKTSEVPKDRWKKFKGMFNKERQAALHNCLIIGIDFGTTYSGVSWTTVAGFEEENINIITKWPGSDSDQAKVPTQLYYEYGDETPLWGFQIQNDLEALQWFKLLLLREDDMWTDLQESAQIGQARRLLRENGKTAQDCIADYLRAIWKHTQKIILKAHPNYLIEALQFHVVLTVPAIWKDYARKAMKQAAQKAGILDYRSAGETTLTFAPEPEAAGLAALIDRGTDAEPDDVFVICDAGGGTVDVITYKVGNNRPLQLHEAVEGDGSVCGGIFIDEDFIVQCRNRIGRKWSNFSPAHIKTILTEEWEYGIKPRYAQTNRRDNYPVSILHGPLSGSDLNDKSREPHIKSGYIHFSSSHIQKAFDDRAVPGLLKLVDSQLKKAYSKGLNVTGIVLLSKIRFQRRTAICRGAILKGLMDAPVTAFVPNAPSVLSTVSRTCLGVKMSQTFQQGVHRKKDRYFCEMEGRYRARNQMDWFIKKGDEVAKAGPIRNDYYRTYTNKEDFQTSSFNVTIYQNDSEHPPTRLTDSVTSYSTLEFNLEGFEYGSLEDHTGPDGRKCMEFNYTLEMVPSGASTELAIYVQGQKVGSELVSIKLN